jgi:uncharacterized protein
LKERENKAKCKTIKMKFSKYNRLIFHENKYYLYSSLTNSLSEISESLYNYFASNIDGDLKKDLPSEIIEELRINRNIVEDDSYDVLRLRHATELNRRSGKKVYLTIAPTMDCNFNCYYCFEKNHEKLYMNAETENHIINYIKQIVGLEELSVYWFGGEPLLAFKVIKRLSKKIKEIPIKYRATIITNGYNLDTISFDEFLYLQISDIQITIDGTREIHDARRQHKEYGKSFDKIVSNIKLITEQAKGRDEQLSISVRVNIDNDNMINYHELREFLYSEIKYSNFHISFGWIRFTKDRKIESFCVNRADILSFCEENKEFKEVHDLFYPRNEIFECFVRNYWGIVVGPDGSVYKCWEELGESQYKLGTINDLAFLSSKRQLEYLYLSDQFTNKSCSICNILPICKACPKDFIDKTSFGKCPDLKTNLEKYLKMHIEKNERGSKEGAAEF